MENYIIPNLYDDPNWHICKKDAQFSIDSVLRESKYISITLQRPKEDILEGTIIITKTITDNINGIIIGYNPNKRTINKYVFGRGVKSILHFVEKTLLKIKVIYMDLSLLGDDKEKEKCMYIMDSLLYDYDLKNNVDILVGY